MGGGAVKIDMQLLTVDPDGEKIRKFRVSDVLENASKTSYRMAVRWW